VFSFPRVEISPWRAVISSAHQFPRLVRFRLRNHGRSPPIASFTYGNSEAQTRSFDNNYWPTALNTVYSGTYVQELSLGEDSAGNITSITDTLDSTRNESFGVDGLNRLHTASGKYGSRTYTYDSNSNRATKYNGTTTWTTTNGNIITKISRFDINPDSGHVQRLGEH
jgi:hypothetical protein